MRRDSQENFDQAEYPIVFKQISEREREVAQSCPTLCDPMDTRLLHPWDFLGKSTGVGCHFLLQGIFPTQGSNPGLLHCGQMLYHLSHQGSLYKIKRETKELGMETHPGEGVVKEEKFPNTRKASHW